MNKKNQTSHAPATQCRLKGKCPFASACRIVTKGEAGWFTPELARLGKGSRLWGTWGGHNYIYVIQDGVFEIVIHSYSGKEFPFALFSSGIALGLSELYIPPETSSAYSTRTLLEGTACCIPRSQARKILNSDPNITPEQAVAYSATNQCTSMLFITKILSHQSVHDKVLALFHVLKKLTETTSFNEERFPITHDEIAFVTCSDRGSVTRVLKKMRAEGLVELGYSDILVNFDKCTSIEEEDYYTEYFFPGDERRSIDLPR